MIQRVEAGRDLTQASLNQLGNALPDMVQNGVTAVRIDVSKVVEFDSTSLESLLEFEALARSRGMSMTVVAPGEMLAGALHITGIAERIEIEAGVRPVAPVPEEAVTTDDAS